MPILRIDIRVRRGVLRTLCLDSSCTIADLKAAFGESNMCPVHEQRIMYRQNMTHDGLTLEQYGMQEVDTVVFEMRNGDGYDPKCSYKEQSSVDAMDLAYNKLSAEEALAEYHTWYKGY